MMKPGGLKVTKFWITCSDDGQVIIDYYVCNVYCDGNFMLFLLQFFHVHLFRFTGVFFDFFHGARVPF